MTGMNNFKKNLIWNVIGVTANAFTSLFYVSIVSRINGLDDAGFFSFAFSNAMLLSVIGLYMGRTYQISDDKCSDRSFMTTRVISCAVMLLTGLAMVGVYHYPVKESGIFFAWIFIKTIDAFVDFLYGILQKNNKLYITGISLMLKAVAGVVLFTVIDLLTQDILLATFGVLAANLTVVLLVDYRQYRKCRTIDQTSRQQVIFLLRDGFFIFGTTILSNYLINASRYAINKYGDNSQQAIFGFIIMPATFMILIGQYLLHPLLVELASMYQHGRWQKLISVVGKMAALLLAVGIAGVLAAYALGIPVLELIYAADLGAYRLDLVVIIAGSVLYSIVLVCINVMTIMHVNRLQFVIFAAIAAGTFGLSRLMVKANGVSGGAFTYFLSMLAAAVVFCTILTVLFIKGSKHESINHNSGI